MRVPDQYMADEIKNWDVSTEVRPGMWVCARPLSLSGRGIRRRVKAAWAVFLGRADVLLWREG